MISFAVMAHESRRPLAEAIRARLEHYVTEAPIEWDVGRGEWDTGRRALLAYDPAADWHAVIQDDAILSTHFEWALEHALEHAGEHPLGLYLGRVRPQPRTYSRAVAKALEHGTPWVEAVGPRWGVGIAIPTRFIPALVAQADLYSHPHYDARVTRFFKMANVYARYPIPSLVDHDPTRPSLLDSGGGDRRAYAFLGDRDPAELDWQADPVKVDARGRVVVPSSV